MYLLRICDIHFKQDSNRWRKMWKIPMFPTPHYLKLIVTLLSSVTMTYTKIMDTETLNTEPYIDISLSCDYLSLFEKCQC